MTRPLKRILCAAALAGLAALPALAQDWVPYDRQPAKVLEINAQGLRAFGEKVYYEYRELWVSGTYGPTVIRAQANCATRERGDLQRDGSYAMRGVYAGTGQEAQLKLACRLAGLAQEAASSATSTSSTASASPGPQVPSYTASVTAPPTSALPGGSAIQLLSPPQPDPSAQLRWTKPESRPPLKVAFAYVGQIGDGGWTFAHDRGRKALELQLNRRTQVTWIENVPEGPAGVAVFQSLVDKGNTLIFATSLGHGEAVHRVAAANPGVKFEHAGGWQAARNVRNYEIRTEEGAYLAGIVAGHMSRSGIIGLVAPIAVPEIVRNINAFTLAARSVNPKVRTRVAWVGKWFDPAGEAQAAQELIAGGADVLLQNTDSSAVLATAQRLGKRAIGWDSDMSAYGPTAHLGSVAMNWGPYYVRAAGNAIDGSWTSGRSRGGVRQDAIGLVSLASDVPGAARERIAQVSDGLKNGSFSIWRGPIATNEGRQMIGPDAAIDEAHLETLYFLVEGVEGRLPALK